MRVAVTHTRTHTPGREFEQERTTERHNGRGLSSHLSLCPVPGTFLYLHVESQRPEDIDRQGLTMAAC